MSAITMTRFTCDCPGCEATVEAPGTRYDYETYREKLPEGWAMGEGRFAGKRIACPEHAPVLVQAERAMYEWECRETEARNTWMRVNPVPDAPAWIDPNAPSRPKPARTTGTTLADLRAEAARRREKRRKK